MAPQKMIDMKKICMLWLSLTLWGSTMSMAQEKAQKTYEEPHYMPTQANIQSRQDFSDMKLGIFLHWGIYSMFAQGEWYLQNADINRLEYAKAADGFYPHRFDARQWVRAIKEAGARYICITTRHHDGFSMWKTDQSPYNIVEATPFGRDVIGELAEACHAEGIRLHLYYSHLDWTREDYPWGRTGLKTGKDPQKQDWKSYKRFMNNQLTELLTRYGDIGAIWFDGIWDHDQDSVPFNWELREQYDLIHRLQPACLVGNNHHLAIKPGEDIQIFERDLPGQNTAGFVDKAAEVSRLPLETCQTMNGMWGYKVTDQNYKSTADIIQLLVRTAGMGANLLLNIGPQPNGELPATALSRLREMGEWTRQYGETLYGTTAGDIAPQAWGATTRKGNRQFIHITSAKAQMQPNLQVQLKQKIKSASLYGTSTKVIFKQTKDRLVTFTLPDVSPTLDLIIEVE